MPSLTVVLAVIMGVGWFATSAYLIGKAKIDIVHARSDQAQKDDVACNKKIDDFAAVVNGEADNEVNAANEAAELIPMLKDRKQLEQRCKDSPYCRKPQGTADANGAD
jgi:hypothetical protein